MFTPILFHFYFNKTIAYSLKGQSHEILYPQFFFLNGTPGSPDLWAKAVLNIDSNWRSNSIRFDAKNRLRAMPHCAESIFFCSITLNLNIYFTAMGQARSPMTDFLIDFNRLL
jgi:hypothetical protein